MKEIALENRVPFVTITDNLKVKLVEFGGKLGSVRLNADGAKRGQPVREEIVSEIR